jgi:hypothetical protein
MRSLETWIEDGYIHHRPRGRVLTGVFLWLYHRFIRNVWLF